jgi:catechol 2,3-dioxygenase-like lactoylglutathione lyase family enzyme
MIQGIGHVAFMVSDMKKALEFYCDVLGFKFVFNLKFEDGRDRLVYIQAGPSQFIELFYGATKERHPFERDRMGYYHFCLQVEDAEDALRQIKEKGYPIHSELKMGDDRNYQFWLKDPDGNAIEFMQLMPNSPQVTGSL